MGVVSQTATTVARKSVACHKLKLKLFGKKPVIGASKFSKKVPLLSCLEKSTLTGEQRTSYAGNNKLNLILGTERKPERALDCQERKRLKMDRGATLNCEVVLEKLMKHRHGYPFIQPEYFDIVENIMDLGTIKGKLDQNMYYGAEEFESDVRLTFSTAMLYNPTNNAIHQYAKELITIFDNLWKPVKAKMNRQLESTRQRTSESSLGKTAHDMNKKCLKSLCSHVDKLPEKTMFPREEKCEDGKAKDYKSSKTHRPAPDSIGPVSCRCEDRACPMFAYPNRSRERRVQSIMNMNRENAKKVRSVKNVPRNQCKAVEVKNTQSQVSRSDSDSNAPVSSMDEEHASISSLVTTGSIDGTATTKGLETILDIELSPSKALRAAV